MKTVKTVIIYGNMARATSRAIKTKKTFEEFEGFISGQTSLLTHSKEKSLSRPSPRGEATHHSLSKQNSHVLGMEVSQWKQTCGVQKGLDSPVISQMMNS